LPVSSPAAVVLNRDNPQFARLNHTRSNPHRSHRFLRSGREIRARLLDLSLHATCSRARQYSRSRHHLQDRHARPSHGDEFARVLAGASLLGADLARAALSLSQLEAAAGRGVRRVLEVGHGEATLIDESYNANPASMARRSMCSGRPDRSAWPAHRGARRHARTRTDRSRAARSLAEAIKSNHIDLVYCCGPLMRNLWDALSTGKRGGYAETPAPWRPRRSRRSARRRHHGEGVAGFEDEADCQCAGKALSRQSRTRRSGIGHIECFTG